MLEPLLAKLRAKLEGKIDFHGQDLVEERQRRILWTTGAVAFCVGFVAQSLRLLMLVFSLGFFACLAVTGPSYSTYNQHPIKWVEPLDEFGLDHTHEGAPALANAVPLSRTNSSEARGKSGSASGTERAR
ncbi:hypothetical protein JCM10212_000546 [Sporobolomyces blumeae]